MICGQCCPREHLRRDWHPNPCEKPDGHDGQHVCSNPDWHAFTWPINPDPELVANAEGNKRIAKQDREALIRYKRERGLP